MTEDAIATISPDEALHDFYDHYLSEQNLTGECDLNAIKFLELKVDSRKVELAHLGKIAPGLHQLKLNNSFVSCIRELGTGYNNLNVLWIARCNLSDLDGIGSLRSLKELYLAWNEVADISDLSMLSNLEILDLESNEISNVDQLEYLALCPNLQQLTLEGNPIEFTYNTCSNPEDSEQNLKQASRRTVQELIPQLKWLDDTPLQSQTDIYLKPQDPILEENQQKIVRPASSTGVRPQSSPVAYVQCMPQQPSISVRPTTSFAMRPLKNSPVYQAQQPHLQKHSVSYPLSPVSNTVHEPVEPLIKMPSRPTSQKRNTHQGRRVSTNQERPGLKLPDIFNPNQMAQPMQPTMPSIPKPPPATLLMHRRKLKQPVNDFIELSAKASEEMVNRLGKLYIQ